MRVILAGIPRVQTARTVRSVNGGARPSATTRRTPLPLAMIELISSQVTALTRYGRRKLPLCLAGFAVGLGAVTAAVAQEAPNSHAWSTRLPSPVVLESLPAPPPAEVHYPATEVTPTFPVVKSATSEANRSLFQSENGQADGERAAQAARNEGEPSLSDLKELTEKLEERVDELEREAEESRQEAEQEAEEAKRRPTFEYGGRIHLDYWDFFSDTPGIGFFEHPNPGRRDFGTDPEDRVVFRRIRLELEGELPEDMEWRMQIDFNNPATPEYKDVYFGWNSLPANQTFLLGNQKRPLGLDHLNSSRFNVFAERPLVVEAFNEDARRVGACMYGHTDQQDASWSYGLFRLENSSTTGRVIGDSRQAGGYGRLAFSPFYDATCGGRNYFHWALAGAIAKPDGDVFPGDTNQNEGRFRTRPLARSESRWIDTGPIDGADWYQIMAVENMLNLGPWQFTGEYMNTFLQRDDSTPGTGPDVNFQGFYVYAAYFLTGEHMPYSRDSGTLARVEPCNNFSCFDRFRGTSGRGWGAWQVAARYDFLDLSDEDITGGQQQSVTLGLNWYWTAYAKLQANLIYGDIQDRGPIGGFDSGQFWIGGTRWMCDF